jgi:hypothetical protein
VAVAEKLGKQDPTAGSGPNNAFQATVMTAVQLECSTMVAGVSTKMSADEQVRTIGDVWEQITDERKRSLRVLN